MKIQDSEFNEAVYDYFGIYKKGIWDFVIWFIMSVIVALIGVWLPFCVNQLLFTNIGDILTKLGVIGEEVNLDEDKLYMYRQILKGNPYILFSITFLAEALVSMISIKKAKNECIKFGPLRLILGIITSIYITVLGGMIVILEIFSISLNTGIQTIILFVTIILGIFLYPLKANLFIEGTNALPSEQNTSIASIQKKAITKTKTKDGLPL
ncbi:MAG: hypothetical protein MJ188_11620 [Treponema sp.]|nr:hypothetical protein [Treponema sp.]